jgi:hypothetical protein
MLFYAVGKRNASPRSPLKRTFMPVSFNAGRIHNCLSCGGNKELQTAVYYSFGAPIGQDKFSG